MAPFAPNLLLVSQPSRFRDAVKLSLEQADYAVFEADSVGLALDALRREQFAVVVAAQRMDDGSGVDLLQRTKDAHPNTIVALLEQDGPRQSHDRLDVAIRMPVSPAAIADRLRAFVPATTAAAAAERAETPTRELESVK